MARLTTQVGPTMADSSNVVENAISAYDTARSTVQGAPLSSEELREIDEY